MKKKNRILSLFFMTLLCFSCHVKEDKITAKEILSNPNYLAISYGGYRDVSREKQPTIKELKEDLKILSAMGVRVLRTYNVQARLPHAANVLKAIDQLKKEDVTFKMYVMLGVWIDCLNAWTDNKLDHTKESYDNKAEVARAVILANKYPDIVKMISVGNEAMVKWAESYYVEPKVILKWVNYLQDLKKKGELSTDIWITSSDDYSSWGGGDHMYHTEELKQLIHAVDFISMHTYPYHNTHYNPAFWWVPDNQEALPKITKIDRAMLRARDYAISQYDSVKNFTKSIGVNKPIHIGETGWSSISNGFYGAKGSRASDEYKLGLYYHYMRKWSKSKKISCFYFEAFDEQWKDSENVLGSENHFGLINLKNQVKYPLWSLFDKGVFNDLKRNEQPLTKTFNGDLNTLKKTILPLETNVELGVTVYETSAAGNKMTKVSEFIQSEKAPVITINPTHKFQKITGFGGAFTEASAYLLNKISKKKRDTILQAYFSKKGANYSLTRTHMNSCDFSLNQYSYAPVENDMALKHFSVKEDVDDLIPMIKEAQKISKDGFKILASPWTAPPWMKDNNKWVGGKLLPKYYDTWALFFSKYLKEYENKGINIWGFTVENEPNGNGNNWESMHFTPKEMTDFVQNYLGPKLEKDGYGDKVILGYDQNRAGLKEWVDVMYTSKATSKYYSGTAIHWYESTYAVFEKELQYAHYKAPEKYLIQTEGCIDAEVPEWKNDAWYWKKEATDWGWDWAAKKDKYLHPKYAPAHRYARDIIGCLNNWVDGWIDWNMVLDKQGGPNWFKNWCVAPVLVDEDKDEVYFTPLFYVMAHFSKYIRPNAHIIETENLNKNLQVVAAQNTDKSIVVVVFNEDKKKKSFNLRLDKKEVLLHINEQAIQTIIIPAKN